MPLASGNFSERSNANNYTIGGVRFWFSELLDDTTSPKRYDGFVDLGCIESAPLAQAITYQEHFCAQTGFRLKDKKVPKEIASTFNVTLIEADPNNLRLFFLGDTIQDVAVSPGGGSASGEIVKLKAYERRILDHGVGATAIVVQDTTGVTTYVLNTDYTVETYFNYVAIRRKAGGAITDGQYVQVAYTYDILASKTFNAVTNIQKKGKAKFIGVSDSGQEFLYEHINCSVSPNGDFNFNNNDWTTFQLSIELLSDAANNPSTPYGKVTHLGLGPVL